MKKDRLIRELTIMLIFLSSRDEKIYGSFSVKRAWKGYNFKLLRKLEEEGIISGIKYKSITLEDKGIKEARRLLEKHYKTRTL